MSDGGLSAMMGTPALKAGHFNIEFVTPGIGIILKNAGCDFTVFDMEHSGFGIDTIKQAIAFARAADLPSIVRVPSKDYKDVARVCDMGADGIMVPMVGTVAEAESIVRSMKYVPRGERGVILRGAHDRYSVGPTKEKMAAANARTIFVALIETAEGVENAADIAAIDGVDCLWVGHFDLSCSLGIPGDFDHPKFAAAIETVVAAGKGANKSLGRLVTSVAEGVALYKQGFDVLSYSIDAWALGDAVAAGLAGMRDGVAGQ